MSPCGIIENIDNGLKSEITIVNAMLGIIDDIIIILAQFFSFKSPIQSKCLILPKLKILFLNCLQ